MLKAISTSRARVSPRKWLLKSITYSRQTSIRSGWRGGQYVSVDGIFSEVVSQKGNVWKIRAIGKKDIAYLVTDGQGRWSHGDTPQAARDDLIHKIGNRDTSRYSGLTMESVLPLADAIEAYRVIIGACAAGTRQFVQGLPHTKEAYTIGEICELAKGQYGAQRFLGFFASGSKEELGIPTG